MGVWVNGVYIRPTRSLRISTAIENSFECIYDF